MGTFYAEDIKWKIDEDDVWDFIMNTDREKIAEILGHREDYFKHAETSEIFDEMYEYAMEDPQCILEFLGLEEEVALPDDLDTSDKEDVEDYLGSEYGHSPVVGYVYEDKTADKDEDKDEGRDIGEI